jgi:hypothetical protein
MSDKNQECCPQFDPTPWDKKIFEWDNKKFIKDKVFTLFYMPMNFGAVMKRMNRKVDESGTKIPDYLCLSDHTSKWNMDIYLAVDKEVPDAENVPLSGKFLSKVYEGDFKETGKWCEDFENYVKGRNLEVKKWYMWYTTCPKCAKKYGKNYVVIIGQVG